jgi:hypothetical protein
MKSLALLPVSNRASSVSWQNTHTLNWKKRDCTWGLLGALLESR